RRGASAGVTNQVELIETGLVGQPLYSSHLTVDRIVGWRLVAGVNLEVLCARFDLAWELGKERLVGRGGRKHSARQEDDAIRAGACVVHCVRLPARDAP